MKRLLSIFVLFCFGILLITLSALSIDCISDNNNQYKSQGHYNFSVVSVLFGVSFVIISIILGVTGIGGNGVKKAEFYPEYRPIPQSVPVPVPQSVPVPVPQSVPVHIPEELKRYIPEYQNPTAFV